MPLGVVNPPASLVISHPSAISTGNSGSSTEGHPVGDEVGPGAEVVVGEAVGVSIGGSMILSETQVSNSGL